MSEPGRADANGTNGNAALPQDAGFPTRPPVTGAPEAPAPPSRPRAIAPGPELVIGMVAPLGADLARVERELADALRAVNYAVEHIRLSEFLDPQGDAPGADPGAGRSSAKGVAGTYARKMDAGTEFCRQSRRHDALAMVAIQMIRARRADVGGAGTRGSPVDGGGAPAAPLPRTAYVVHQLKRPEEVARLRAVYEGRFRLVAVWEPREVRIDRLARRLARQGKTSNVARFREAAERLVDRDDRELTALRGRPSAPADKYGQNVRDTFPLADVFVSPSLGGDLGAQIRRFVRALFGDPTVTPSREEFGMHLATTAAMRSGSLARQVGAAACTAAGEVVTLGTNEVPKPYGGLYWDGDPGDDRDIARGHDVSDLYRHSLVGEVLEHLQKAKWLRKKMRGWSRERLVTQALARDGNVLRSAGIMDVMEFVRALHAEQAAIMDAAARGVAIRGATLYVTTFPCHECARMILGAGISRVVYIEPYAKSRALEQYPAGITTDPEDAAGQRVPFLPFLGIAPRFFRIAFEWTTSRKADDGTLVEWDRATAQPRGVAVYPGHIVAELFDMEEYRAHLSSVASSSRASAPGDPAAATARAADGAVETATADDAEHDSDVPPWPAPGEQTGDPTTS